MCAQHLKEVIILCTYKRKTLNNCLLQLVREIGATNKVLHLYFCIFVQYLQFVSGALKWPQNLAGLKLVFNKLGVLWWHHWLCVLYWTFTANLTPPHTLQYEISCWHIPCWWPAYQHPNTTYAGRAGHQLCCSMLFFSSRARSEPPPQPPKSHSQNLRALQMNRTTAN